MYDRLENLELAVYALDDAIDAIAALGKHSECDVQCLRDIRREYEVEIEEIKEELYARHEREIEALTAEYYRAVI